MVMKEISLPKELLNLPQPWSETDFLRRHEQLNSLTHQANEIKRALNVLERCLHSFSRLTPPNALGDSIPESLLDSWAFTARWLADEMPILDELTVDKVEGKLKEYGIESPSSTLTLELSKYWLWSVVSSISEAALYWVEDALMKTRELSLISCFLYIAERYWQEVDSDLADSLLGASAMIGRQKALPLFESVSQNPNASEDILETVRDYRDLILDSPEKWLPESDAFVQLPVNGNQNGHLQQSTEKPAVAELAYV